MTDDRYGVEVFLAFSNPTAKEMADFFASLPPETSLYVVDDSGLTSSEFWLTVDEDANVAYLEPYY